MKGDRTNHVSSYVFSIVEDYARMEATTQWPVEVNRQAEIARALWTVILLYSIMDGNVYRPISKVSARKIIGA